MQKSFYCIITFILAFCFLITGCAEKPAEKAVINMENTSAITASDNTADADAKDSDNANSIGTLPENNIPSDKEGESNVAEDQSNIPADEDDGMTEYHVSTVEELMRNLTSDARIVLAPGVYNLSTWMAENYENIGDYPAVSILYGELIIGNINNVEIKAENDMLTQIVTEDAYSCVLGFEFCKNIMIDGIVFGHAVEPGYCSGSVLKFETSSGVKLNDLNLYGCGTYGIEAYGCSDFDIDTCWIHDCTYGAVYLYSCYDFYFKDTSITYNKEYSTLTMSDAEVTFENCLFEGNIFGERDRLISNYTEYVNRVEFINCRFGDLEKASIDSCLNEYITIR